MAKKKVKMSRAPAKGDAIGSNLIRNAVREMLLEAVTVDKMSAVLAGGTETVRAIVEGFLAGLEQKMAGPEAAQALSDKLTRMIHDMLG